MKYLITLILLINTALADELYTVQPGDTPLKIARKFEGGSQLAYLILAENRVPDASKIRPGDVLLIPLDSRQPIFIKTVTRRAPASVNQKKLTIFSSLGYRNTGKVTIQPNSEAFIKDNRELNLGMGAIYKPSNRFGYGLQVQETGSSFLLSIDF